MPTFTVKEIVGQREWSPPDDPSKTTVFWSFKAEGEDKVCSIGRRKGNDLRVGESFEATATEDRGGLKLKKVQAFGGGGGGFRMDPAKDRRITRQHSQDMGIQTIALGVSMGLDFKFTSGADIVAAVKKLADVYDADAYRAGEQS